MSTTFDNTVLQNSTGFVASDASGAQAYANAGGQATASNLQLGASPSLTVSSNGASGEYVAPFIASLYVDASGKVGVLEQQTVTITGIDSIFDLTATEAQSVKLLRAFKVTDLNADVAAPSWGAAGTVSADIQVDMQNGADFRAALTDVIGMQGLTADHNNGITNYETLYKYLKREAHKDTVDLLSYDSLANMLEGSDLLEFDIKVDASQGAQSMWDAMNSSAKAEARRAMFTQLPLSNVHEYLNPSDGVNGGHQEEVRILNFLPLLKGDKLSLVFDVTVGEYSFDSVAPTSGAEMYTATQDAGAPLANPSVTAADPSGTISGVSATTNTYSKGKLTFTVPTRRRIALRVQMSTGGVIFTEAAYQAADQSLDLAH